VGKLTSTQEPHVIPSIRNSHFSVFPRGVPRGSFSRKGSSTLPVGVAEASLYHRPEKVDDRADMVGERRDIRGSGTQEKITGGKETSSELYI
jgi:hypothetical protein